ASSPEMISRKRLLPSASSTSGFLAVRWIWTMTRLSRRWMTNGTCEARGPRSSAATMTPKPRSAANASARLSSIRNWGRRTCMACARTAGGQRLFPRLTHPPVITNLLRLPRVDPFRELPLPLRQIESAEHRDQSRRLQRGRGLAEQKPAGEDRQRRHGGREHRGARNADGL